MSATAIVILVLVIVVVAALAASLAMTRRRRRLRDRFGPEYDRAVSEHESRREAEAELAQRERRVRELDIRPLSEAARARYAQQWNQLQEGFVDAPADVVAASQVLVTQVITERGYPADDHDQVLADLSVDHARTLERYRAAEQVSATAVAGRASTEDLRQAMVHYRALFRELLDEPAGATTATATTAADEPAADEPALDRAAVDEPYLDEPDADEDGTDDFGAGQPAARSAGADPVGSVAADPVTADPEAADPEAADREAAGLGAADLEDGDDGAVRVPAPAQVTKLTRERRGVDEMTSWVSRLGGSQSQDDEQTAAGSQQDAGAPEGSAPQDGAPEGSTHWARAPEGSAPEGSAPEGSAPDETVSDETVPGSAPDDGQPEGRGTPVEGRVVAGDDRDRADEDEPDAARQEPDAGRLAADSDDDQVVLVVREGQIIRDDEQDDEPTAPDETAAAEATGPDAAGPGAADGPEPAGRHAAWSAGSPASAEGSAATGPDGTRPDPATIDAGGPAPTEDGAEADGREALRSAGRAGSVGAGRAEPGRPGHDPAGNGGAGTGAAWQEIQAMFVDDPRASVTQADVLVEERIEAFVASVDRIVASVKEKQRTLQSAWPDADTEQLRLSLHDYRELWQRLEAMPLDI